MEEVAEGELYIIEKLIRGHAAALNSLNVKNEHENVPKNIGEKHNHNCSGSLMCNGAGNLWLTIITNTFCVISL